MLPLVNGLQPRLPAKSAAYFQTLYAPSQSAPRFCSSTQGNLLIWAHMTRSHSVSFLPLLIIRVLELIIQCRNHQVRRDLEHAPGGVSALLLTGSQHISTRVLDVVASEYHRWGCIVVSEGACLQDILTHSGDLCVSNICSHQHSQTGCALLTEALS